MINVIFRLFNNVFYLILSKFALFIRILEIPTSYGPNTFPLHHNKDAGFAYKLKKVRKVKKMRNKIN